MLEFPVMVPGASPATDPLRVTCPFDQSPVGQVARVDAGGIEQALSNAEELFNNRARWLSKAERVAILERAVTLMEVQQDELVQIALAEGGKPLLDSKVEVARAIDGIKNCIECLRNHHGDEIPMGINPASKGRLAFTQHEPIGVVVAVSAFNHPLNLIVHQIGPAIAAGCPVIIKPAEDTPLSCFKLVELLQQAGLPPDYCQPVITTDLTVATQLVTDARVQFFSFIGSAKVGWMLKSKLAPGTRCALEHGGVAPAIVSADAALSDVIPLLAKGAFYHAGQVCVSVQRVYIEKPILDECVAQLSQWANHAKVGDPALETTDIGPLIRPTEVDRIEQWVEEAVSEGAQLICGGKRLSDTLFAPTILLNPAEHSKVSCQEVFGPVLCVYDYDSLDQAIARANALPFAFQAAVMTSNIDTALYAYQNLAAAAVMVNDHTAFRVDWMPFAGLKQSGYGIGGIPHTFADMQIEKMLMIRSSML